MFFSFNRAPVAQSSGCHAAGEVPGVVAVLCVVPPLQQGLMQSLYSVLNVGLKS